MKMRLISGGEGTVSVAESFKDLSSTPEPIGDVEKGPVVHDEHKESPLTVYTYHRLHESRYSWFWRASYFLDKFGEIRGLERQSPDRRYRGTFWHWMHMLSIWFGAACTIPSMTGFFLGPTLFELSFRASVSSGVLGVFVGSIGASIGAVMGPRSGLRSMVGSRFQFGWWFSKFIGLLNCCTLIGWLMVNGNFSGQLLNAISGISYYVGLVIMFLASWLLAVFGIKYLILFEEIFIVPLVVSFLLCYVCTGHEFEATAPSKVTGIDLRANWLSFFSSCIGITSTWIGIASDYYLDMPESSNPWFVFFFTLFSIWIPTSFVGILGAGLASATLYNQEKLDLYNSKNGGGGALIWDGMKRWHGGGKFLVIIMYISLITNGVVTNYSFGLSFQSLAKPFARTPRYILVTFGAIVYFVLTAVGRDGWADVVANFLPMIGYWSMIYAVILGLESFWFRRKKENEYQWDQYLNRHHFPPMFAAIFSFGVGVAGAVISMDQYYFVAPLAKQIGSGAEMGTVMCIGFTAVAYLPSRYLEIWLTKDKPLRP